MNWLSIRTPLTTDEISFLESQLPIILPSDYKEQIGPINGGALRNAYIHLPPLGQVPYARNVPLQKNAKAGAYDLAQIINPGPIRLFPFGIVGNGDYFCFDLPTDTVLLYLHETGETIYVCDSFTQLLTMIVTE